MIPSVRDVRRPAVADEDGRAARVGGRGTIRLACADLEVRRQGHTAVVALDLTIHAGECYGLLGPNGAGKTSTILAICGLVRTTRGRVEVCGQRLTPLTLGVRSHLRYVPQEIALYPGLTVWENVALFGTSQGLHGRRLRSEVAAALEAVGLADRRAQELRRLSTGMQRRASLAVALLNDPAVLILDEPTVGLDAQSRAAIHQQIRTLVSEGKAVLLASHDFREIEQLCDRVGILDEGRLITEATPRRLVAQTGLSSTIELRTSGPAEALAGLCRQIPGVVAVSVGDAAVSVAVSGNSSRVVAELARAAADRGHEIEEIEMSQPTLEDAFLQLTGKALRE